MPTTIRKVDGKWRVVEKATGNVVKRGGKAVDGGGYSSMSHARSQSQAININQHKKK